MADANMSEGSEEERRRNVAWKHGSWYLDGASVTEATEDYIEESHAEESHAEATEESHTEESHTEESHTEATPNRDQLIASEESHTDSDLDVSFRMLSGLELQGEIAQTGARLSDTGGFKALNLIDFSECDLKAEYRARLAEAQGVEDARYFDGASENEETQPHGACTASGDSDDNLSFRMLAGGQPSGDSSHTGERLSNSGEFNVAFFADCSDSGMLEDEAEYRENSPARNIEKAPAVTEEANKPALGGKYAPPVPASTWAPCGRGTSGRASGPGSFDVDRLLGAGGFGRVYQVTHRHSGDQFAMKVIQKTSLTERDSVRYALTERNVAAHAKHPFIVPLMCAFQTSSCLLLILQLCPNGDLESLLKRERCLPETLAQLYVAQLFLALEHLHQKKIVYRDLKPANVVLDEGRHAMLTDFGLSKQNVAGPQGTRSFIGSKGYMAPEVLAETGHGAPTDVFGLGLLLFEMLTGHTPWATTTREEALKNIASGQLQAPLAHSEHAKAFVEATVTRDLFQRLGAAAISELRSHPFLAEIDLEKVLRRELTVPVLPMDHPERADCADLPRGVLSTVAECAAHERYSAHSSHRSGFDEFIPESFDETTYRQTIVRHLGSLIRPSSSLKGWDYREADDSTRASPRVRGACLFNLRPRPPCSKSA